MFLFDGVDLIARKRDIRHFGIISDGISVRKEIPDSQINLADTFENEKHKKRAFGNQRKSVRRAFGNLFGMRVWVWIRKSKHKKR